VRNGNQLSHRLAAHFKRLLECLARKGAAALLGALFAALLFQRLLRDLLRELLRLLLTFHGPILRRRAGGQKKGRPAGRPLVRFPYVSAAQASGQAQTDIAWTGLFRPPPEGGYLQTTRSGAAARLRFCSPVRESRSNSVRPRRMEALRMRLPRRPRRIGALSRLQAHYRAGWVASSITLLRLTALVH
jgi:hypothetical protein